MANRENNGTPWFMRLMRPPTTEQKGFSITTEVGILLLQGLALIAFLAIGGALAHAALLAWDLNVMEVKIVGWGGGLVILLLWLHDRLVDTEVGKAAAVLIGSSLGYFVAVNALAELLLLQPDLEVQIVSLLIVVVALVLILVLGTLMVFAKHYKAAAWFTVVVAAVAAAVWWFVPDFANDPLWPWVLSGLAFSVGYSVYWTGRAYKTEIDDPQKRGMTGLDRAILTWVGNEWLNQQEPELAPDQPVLINPRNDLREKEQRWAWERFLHYAFTDSSTERLEKMGYPRRSRIEPWRDALMASGWAAWNDEQNHKLGWHLTADVDEILGNMDFPS